MKFIVQFSFVCASLLYRYFICILTLFLELMYLRLSKWATMFSLSITVIYFSNVNDHFVSHPFTDYLPISICIVIVLADWHTTASIWQDFDDLFATVTFLLENSSGAVFITTYHNRRYQRIIASLFRLEEVWQATFLINQLHFSTQWSSSDWVFDGQVGFEVFETAGWFLLPATMQGCFTSGEHSACWNRAWQRKT